MKQVFLEAIYFDGISYINSFSGGPGSQYPNPDATNSPIRHASYASQVGYYLQQQQNQQQVQQAPQQPTPQPPIQLQSGGPRTTPSGYPGMYNCTIIYK